MSDLEIVTTSDRPDLEDETRAAFRQNWPLAVLVLSRSRKGSVNGCGRVGWGS